MTIVAGIVTPEGAWIGSDSLAAVGELCASTASPKIGRFGNILIGFAGSWRAGQVFLEHTAKLSNPTLRQILEADAPVDDWNLLVIEGSRIYEVSADKGVVEAINQYGYSYAAIGSGSSVCLGALGYASDSLSERALRRALVVTAEHTTNVGGPFSVLRL